MQARFTSPSLPPHFYFLFYCHHLHDHRILSDKHAFIPFFCIFPWSGCPHMPVLLLPEHPCSASTVTCLPSSTVAETGPKECCHWCVVSASCGGACLVSEHQDVVGRTLISKMTRAVFAAVVPTFAADHLVLSNLSLSLNLLSFALSSAGFAYCMGSVSPFTLNCHSH